MTQDDIQSPSHGDQLMQPEPGQQNGSRPWPVIVTRHLVKTYVLGETKVHALRDVSLKVYPGEAELNESKVAIGEFIASVKVAHWVELAERSAFKGHYRRAIDRYRDALFYLNQEAVKEDLRAAGTERIEREIAKLRSRLRSTDSESRRRPSERPMNGEPDS